MLNKELPTLFSKSDRAASSFCHGPFPHLAALDYLREGIHLHGYTQKNPKQEYKREAFELFSQMLDIVKMDVTRILKIVRVQSEEKCAKRRWRSRSAPSTSAT